MASPSVAANAYASLADLDTGGAGKGSESGGPSFGALLTTRSKRHGRRKKSDVQTVAMASARPTSWTW